MATPDADGDTGCGCLVIIIFFIIVCSLCDRIEKLEEHVKQGTQADTGYYQTESQTYQQPKDSLYISK